MGLVSSYVIFFYSFIFCVCVGMCVRGGGQEERGTKDKNGVC